MERFKEILWWIGTGIVCIILALIVMMSRGSDAILPSYSIFVVIGIFAIPFAIYIVIILAADKAKQKKEAEKARIYREQYVRPYELLTERFGLLVFDNDTNEDTLKFVEGNLPPIGEAQLEEIVFHDYRGRDNMVVSAFSLVFDRVDEILDECTEVVKESYDEDEIKDENGQLITEQFIRKDICLTDMEVFLDDEYADIEISGSMQTEYPDSFIMEHGLSVSFEGKTGKLYCGIE